MPQNQNNKLQMWQQQLINKFDVWALANVKMFAPLKKHTQNCGFQTTGRKQAIMQKLSW